MKQWLVIMALFVSAANAQEVVIRDSIGPTSLCTDGCANYNNTLTPKGFGFFASKIDFPVTGSLSSTELIVVDAHIVQPTDPATYPWHISIWQDEFGVQSFPTEGDVLAVELLPNEVVGIEWGTAIHPTLGNRQTYKIRADVTRYGVAVDPAQPLYVALYPLSLTPPFLEWC